MKRIGSLLLALLLALGMAGSMAFAEDATLVEACIITETLDWGETVTAIRLEYSEEIYCGAIEHSNEHPGKMTYSIFNDRDIVSLYVNNSGKKDDVQLTGKYVFINLGTQNQDHTTYRDQVTFNTLARTRDQVAPFYVYQNEPITTVAGNVIAPIPRIVTSREICLVVDDFDTFTYTNEETGNFLNYHLYIPEGYDAKADALDNLPLVVHYPSGDYRYVDYNGLYRGALFTHPDALFWATEESQAANPAFVVTVGGEVDSTWGTDFAESEMAQNYVAIIKQIAEEYNVDPARIYCISLAGGTNAMYRTILANPGLFAAQITTAYEPYHAFGSEELGEEMYGKIMDEMPGWIFAGLDDGSGAGVLGAEDTRKKGERYRDIVQKMTEKGYTIELAYGENGELMWNGLLRGPAAEALATEQLARAEAAGTDNLGTLYIPGTILQTMHWSWNATYSNAVVRNWLFTHVNENPAL